MTPPQLLLEGGVISRRCRGGQLSRSKTTRGLPESAIEFLLKARRNPVEGFGQCRGCKPAGCGWTRRSIAGPKISHLLPWLRLIAKWPRSPTSAGNGHHRLLRLQDGAPLDRIVNVEHHLCHAASAFFLRPFERSLIVTMDEEVTATPVCWPSARFAHSRATARSRIRTRSRGSIRSYGISV